MTNVSNKKCPFCGKEIFAQSIRCVHCNRGLVPDDAQRVIDSVNPAAQQVNVTIINNARPKSVFKAFLLALLFGPFGMLYSSVKGGIIMLLLSVIVFIVIYASLGDKWSSVYPFFSYPAHIIGIIWACNAASKYNRRMAQSGRLY